MISILSQIILASIIVTGALFGAGFVMVYMTVSPFEIRGNFGRRKSFFERLVDTIHEIWG